MVKPPTSSSNGLSQFTRMRVGQFCEVNPSCLTLKVWSPEVWALTSSVVPVKRPALAVGRVTPARLNLPQKGLHIGHLNICSWSSKTCDLRELLDDNGFHVFGLSETHLDPSISDQELGADGWTVLRKDRNRHGGGVAFLVRDGLPWKHRTDLEKNNTEMLWIEITT
ncbi:uncharacterized protein LOC144877551 [Branchiostoma floridae x Branchiostoma japonicum]